MNTAKQAMENMEYVRRLLEEKQAGFSASVELAVSFIHRQIEWPEETMELTLPPGHPLAGGRSCRRPCRLAPDGGADAGLPSVARTPHPPLIQAGG
jgi:hypothetical protein